MSTSIFGEKTAPPSEEMLNGALKGSKSLWTEVKGYVASACGKESSEWKFYSKKSGWILVVKSGDRTILYLIPLDGCFKANYVYGEKATSAAMAAGLPNNVTSQISEARVYAEGRSFMLDVATDDDVKTAKKLIDIKHKN
jgi:hypothetical protein